MSWPRQGLLLAQYTHKSFWLHTCTSWDANPCMFVVYSIISTDQIPKEPYMVRVRRTFAFLSPKQLESQLKLRFVSKGSIFWDLFPISGAPGILVKCSLSVRYRLAALLGGGRASSSYLLSVGEITSLTGIFLHPTWRSWSRFHRGIRQMQETAYASTSLPSDRRRLPVHLSEFSFLLLNQSTQNLVCPHSQKTDGHGRS